MNTSNFFKKHLVAIIITFLIISVIIGFYQGRNEIKKEKEELFSPEEEIENDDSKLNSQGPKRETEKPKFIITEENFEKIKVYVFSETDDKTLLPNELSDEKKTEIEKIKNSWKNSLGFFKNEKNTIDEENKKCDLYNTKIQEIKGQFPSLNTQKNNLEQQLKILKKEINDLKNESQQYKYIPNQSTSARTEREANLNRLKVEIEKLQAERLEIVVKIDKIKLEIGILESKQKMYENMLTRAKNFKKMLEERYEDAKKQYQDNILYELNSLYEIISSIEE